MYTRLVWVCMVLYINIDYIVFIHQGFLYERICFIMHAFMNNVEDVVYTCPRGNIIECTG